MAMLNGAGGTGGSGIRLEALHVPCPLSCLSGAQLNPDCLPTLRGRVLTQGHECPVVLLHQVVVQLLLPFIQVLPLILREVHSDVHKSDRNLCRRGFPIAICIDPPGPLTLVPSSGLVPFGGCGWPIQLLIFNSHCPEIR